MTPAHSCVGNHLIQYYSQQVDALGFLAGLVSKKRPDSSGKTMLDMTGQMDMTCRGGSNTSFAAGMDMTCRGGSNTSIAAGMDMTCRGGSNTSFAAGMDMTCRGGSNTSFATGMDMTCRGDPNTSVGGMDTTCRGGGTSFAAMDITSEQNDASMAIGGAVGGQSLASMELTYAAASSSRSGGGVGQSATSGLTITYIAEPAASCGGNRNGQRFNVDDEDNYYDNASFDGGATATVKFRQGPEKS